MARFLQPGFGRLVIAAFILVVAVRPAAAAEALACAPEDQLACACDSAAVKSPNPTVRPCFLADPNRQTFVQADAFAANVFAALNWPLGDRNGVPDYARALSGDYAVVWESWKSTRDVFRADGLEPVAWESDARALPVACRDLDVEAERAKVDGGGSIPLSLPPRLLDEYVNPEGHALIDASGQPVRYEVLMNRQAYDYVVQNRLWSVAALDDYLVEHGKLSLPEGDWNAEGFGEKRGAIFAKAAWKILDPEADEYGRFHKGWAYVTPLVKDGALSHDCALKPIGLVGLHVALKLRSLPDWLWTTFEHRAVAPLWSEVGRSALPPQQSKLPDWMFWSGEGPEATRLNRPAKEPTSGEPSRIVRFYPAGYYYPPVAPGHEPNCATSMEFRCFNERLAEGLKDSVLSNYMLIGSQWRTPPNQHNLIVPETLGNATLESFTQASASCLGCHKYAKASDTAASPGSLDFIFSFDRDVLRRSAPSQKGVDAPGN